MSRRGRPGFLVRGNALELQAGIRHEIDKKPLAIAPCIILHKTVGENTAEYCFWCD